MLCLSADSLLVRKGTGNPQSVTEKFQVLYNSVPIQLPPPLSTARPTYLTTYSLTYLPTSYLPNYLLPTYLLLTYLFMNLPLTYLLLTYFLLTYLPSYLLTNLPLTYITTNLPTYLLAVYLGIEAALLAFCFLSLCEGERLPMLFSNTH